MKMDGVTVQTRFTIKRHAVWRHANWRVYDGDKLICVCCYLRGAEALVELLVSLCKECGK